MSLKSIINELVVANVEESIEFYKNYFEFTVDMTDGEPIIWAQLKKDDRIIMLQDYIDVTGSINHYPKKANSSNLIMFEYSSLEELKRIYDTLKNNNIKFFTEYTETDYGKAEFGVLDPDNNMILVSASI